MSSTKLQEQSGIMVSKFTIRRHLATFGLRSRVPRKKPLLNVEQRKKRLTWALEHRMWTVEDWNRVLWSDETRISLFYNDGQQRVWRRSGEAFKPQCLMPTVKHPTAVMFWSCMCASGVGRLYVVDGTLRAANYITEVLEKKMIPSARDLFLPPDAAATQMPQFIFQQDNAPCHAARVTVNWFQKRGITLMDWPGNSPDINPIENLWSCLKRMVAKEKPTTRQQLIETVIRTWHHVITQQDLQTLVASMPSRCAHVINSRGYPTRY